MVKNSINFILRIIANTADRVMSELRRGDGTIVEWKLCHNETDHCSPPYNKNTYIVMYPDGSVHKWLGAQICCYLGLTIPNGSRWIPNSRTIWKHLTRSAL